jgi:hypothetical protein
MIKKTTHLHQPLKGEVFILYQSRNALINENIEFGRDISIKIEAGYGCDYAPAEGTTTITGNMLITDGTVIIQGGTLELQ